MRAYSEEYGEELRKQKKEYEEKIKREERKKRIIQAILVFLSIVGLIFIIYYVTKTTPQPISSIKPSPKYSYTVTPLVNKDYFNEVRRAFKGAKKSIHILMFVVEMGRTPNDPVNILLQDLIDARRRGVEVKVILERPITEKATQYAPNKRVIDFLRPKGIDAKFDDPMIETHDKFILIDDYIAVIGNHNWTYAALMLNHEDSVLIKSDPADPSFGSYFREVEHQIRPQ